MGALVSCTAALHLFFVLGLFFGMSTVLSQELRHKDALCNMDGCFVVNFQQKTFLDSWKVCKEKGGNMATIKRKEDAINIAILFSTLDSRNLHNKIQVWIGLQRQPRQCKSVHPLRGFSWITGDQDTEYTNWQREDSPSMCTVPRCVTMSYDFIQQGDNFKWLDAPCSVPVDGFLCYYAYRGMCQSLPSEGAGNAIYSTPFDVKKTLLTHVPLGSVATMPCPGPSGEEKRVSCVLKEDGSIRWSGNTPLCSDLLEPDNWCDEDNGGCQHYCRTAGSHTYCECDLGYQLSVDGQSCELSDVCHGAPCEFECLPLSDGYRCDCPEGYLLGPDEHRCVDINECLMSPCEHICENVPGSFVCQCREGYFVNYEGECEDVDECTNEPCEHMCENTLGSYTCHCHLGFSPVPEDQTQCQDVDECQIPWTCDQMCVNYDGGFQCYCEEGYEFTSDQYTCQRIGKGADDSTITPSFPWVTHRPSYSWNLFDYPWNVKKDSKTESEMELPLQEETQSLKWLTDPPKILNSDVIWVTSAPQEERLHSVSVDPVTQTPDPDVKVFAKTTHTTTPDSISSKYILVKKDEDAGTNLPMIMTVTPSSYKPRKPDGDDREEITYFQETTVFPKVTPTRSPMNEGDQNGDHTDSTPEGGKKQSNTWLLIAVLVPLCVFIFVILALVVFFCCHCGIMPHHKNATDCYHWISGAHTAQEATDHSQVVKSCV